MILRVLGSLGEWWGGEGGVLTHKASAVLAEGGLHVRGLGKCVNEAHLAIKQRAGFHEVVDHLLPADLPVSGGERERDISALCLRHAQGLGWGNSVKPHSLVLVQLAELAEVREVVPDGFELVPGDVAVAVRVEVLKNRLQTGGIKKRGEKGNLMFDLQLSYRFVSLRRYNKSCCRKSAICN